MPAANYSRWYRPMVARDTDEPHRASTPLELLFDLCFVVGVSQASGRLHHALITDEIGVGVGRYLMVFFAIWWAWVNFTWFASAYDTDDGLYRVTTFVQITGALILAAGIPRAFDRNDFTVAVIGYVVMRLAMVTQWVRAAISDPEHRVTALRFAFGVTLVQVLWILRLLVHATGLGVASFLVLVLLELLVPIYAEHAAHTTWHPIHIAERYGLFTVIVLGESVLSATTAIQFAFDAGADRGDLLGLSVAGLVIVFGMWWIYFDRPGEEGLSAQSSFVWGYGHYLIFASAAAVGAGIAVNVDVIEHHAEISARTGAFTIAVPVAVYILSTWKLHRRPGVAGAKIWSYLLAAVFILVAPFVPGSVTVIAGVLAALVIVTTTTNPT